MAESATQILIVDDHPLIREGVKLAVSSEPDLAICGEAGDVETALELVDKLHPDVIIVDLTLENGNGLDLISTLVSKNVTVPILVLTMHDENVYAERCLRSGARGFLMKGGTPEALIEAIRTILDGKMYASENLLQRVLTAMLTPTNHDREELSALTDREFQVFELLAQGNTSKEVAAILGRSSKTIDIHRIRIRNKLGLKSNSDLVRFAVEWRREHETASDL